MSPILQEAGHEVVGLDNHLFGDCTFGPEPNGVEALDEHAHLALGGLGREPGEAGDAAPVEAAEFGQLGEQDRRDDRADPGGGLQLRRGGAQVIFVRRAVFEHSLGASSKRITPAATPHPRMICQVCV